MAEMIRLGGRVGAPVLVLGPALGTCVADLYSRCLTSLAADFQVLGWDLPGHGAAAAPAGWTTISSIAEELLEELPQRFDYVGTSVGAAVGLEIARAAPDRMQNGVLVCGGGRLGEPSAWHERAERVLTAGIGYVADLARERWFAPSYAGKSFLVDRLERVDPQGYAAVCTALAHHDPELWLDEITTPMAVVAGSEDKVATPADQLQLAGRLGSGVTVIDQVGHLPPYEAPARMVEIIVSAVRREP